MPAVGVVQDHQMPGWRPAVPEPAEQSPLAQRVRRDPAADIAHHDAIAEVEAQHVTGVDSGVDAADHPQNLVTRERQAFERAAGGEHRVAPDQVGGRNCHVLRGYSERTMRWSMTEHPGAPSTVPSCRSPFEVPDATPRNAGGAKSMTMRAIGAKNGALPAPARAYGGTRWG